MSREPVAVIGYSLWQREFASDPAIVGRTLVIEGKPFTIVGVLPPRFFGLSVGRINDFYLPLAAEPYLRNTDSALWKPCATGWVFDIGQDRARTCKRPPGRARKDRDAADAAGRIARERAPRLPQADLRRCACAIRRFVCPFIPGTSNGGVIGGCRAAVVAGVLHRGEPVARARYCTPEGVCRTRGARGFARTHRAATPDRERPAGFRRSSFRPAVRARRHHVPDECVFTKIGPPAADLSPDWSVFAFALAAAALSVVLFGLAPAVRAARTAPAESLKGGTATASVLRVRRLLLAGQIAVAVVLVTGAVLFGETLKNLVTVDMGFNPNNVLLATLDLRRSNVSEDARPQFYQTLLERMERLPSVESASLSFEAPISGGAWQFSINAETASGPKPVHVHFNAVSTDYFRTFGTAVLAGRGFAPADRKGAPLVAVVNRRLARAAFGTDNPIGRRISLDDPQMQSLEIVGVAQDAKYRDLRREVPPTFYSPFAQYPGLPSGASIALRTHGSEAALLGEVRRILTREFPSLSFNVTTLRTRIHESVSQERAFAVICSLFGALALVLAAIGVYGVLSYLIARRRAEIWDSDGCRRDTRERTPYHLPSQFRRLCRGSRRRRWTRRFWAAKSCIDAIRCQHFGTVGLCRVRCDMAGVGQLRRLCRRYARAGPDGTCCAANESCTPARHAIFRLIRSRLTSSSARNQRRRPCRVRRSSAASGIARAPCARLRPRR